MDASLGVHSSTGWRMLQQQHGRIERSDGGDTVRRQSKAGAASAAQWEEWCASACVLFVLQHACALSTGPLAAFLKYNFFVNGKKSFLLFLSVFCLLSRMRLARHQATVQGCPPAYPFVSILFLFFFFFAWPILLWSRLGSVSLSLFNRCFVLAPNRPSSVREKKKSRAQQFIGFSWSECWPKNIGSQQ